MMIRCEEVIISDIYRRGKGTTDSPVRSVLQVYSKDGNLIAENDPAPDRRYSQAQMEAFVDYLRANFSQVRDSMSAAQMVSGWISNHRIDFEKEEN